MEHHIVCWRTYADEAVRSIVLNGRFFQTLVEIDSEDGRYPTLVEDLCQRVVSTGGRNTRRVDELFEELPTIALYP